MGHGGGAMYFEAAGGKIYTLDGKPLRYAKLDLKNPAIMTVSDFDWVPLIWGADSQTAPVMA